MDNNETTWESALRKILLSSSKDSMYAAWSLPPEKYLNEGKFNNIDCACLLLVPKLFEENRKRPSGYYYFERFAQRLQLSSLSELKRKT